MRFFLAILTIAVTATWVTQLPAAQIVLRSTAEVGGPVVRLSDVAEVVSSDADEKYRLESIELFPVPSQGQKRYLRQREIQDLLTLSGVSLARHRFSGSSQVMVYGQVQEERSASAPISTSSGRRAKQRAEQAIHDYLKETADLEKPTPWQVETQLDESKIRALLMPGTRVSVVQAERLQVGTCRFLLEIGSLNGKSEQIEVEVNLSLPKTIVATVRRLPRGIVLQASDVELVYDINTSQQVQGFYSIQDVVDKELTQAIGAGQILPTDIVRSPIVVRKGEVVTVISRAAGIAVSTNARANEDGGMGELVPVESLENREVYFAKVTGLRELEVLAGSVEVQASTDVQVRPLTKNTRPYAMELASPLQRDDQRRR